MKITVQKRYCFKQAHNWRGGFGSALAEQQKLQEKHPDTEITIEYNERSTSTRYRIVRLKRVEIEVPDRPLLENYDVPEAPEPSRLPDSEVTTEVVDQEGSDWLNRTTTRSVLVATHTPSGTQVKRSLWGSSRTPEKWVVKSARKELEEALDLTYEDRRLEYAIKISHYDDAMTKWRIECDELIREENTLA